MVGKKNHTKSIVDICEIVPSQNIFIVNMFYKVDCVEKNYNFSQKY